LKGFVVEIIKVLVAIALLEVVKVVAIALVLIIAVLVRDIVTRYSPGTRLDGLGGFPSRVAAPGRRGRVHDAR
jgi:hypothetical protein